MKKILLSIAAVLTTLSAAAQTLNVQEGNAIYQFPASSAGEMTYSGGTTLTILNKAFTISNLSQMYTDESEVTNNEVKIVYSGTEAMVYVAANVAQYVTPSISGAYVTIYQTNTDAVDDDEITYVLSGTATDGQFALSGSYKSTISLAGVDLTCSTGAAINVTNSKRIQLSAKSGTTNTITDGSGSQKACIYSKGQLQLQGNGTLNVVGNYKHGIKSASYISIKNLTLNITSTVGDGINCEEYLQMKSGTVTLSGVGDDGIQCDLDEDDSDTGETTDHEDENSGNIYLEGGTLTVTTTAAASKGVKSEGDIIVSDGTYTVTTSGSYEYDSDDADYKSCAAMKADGDMTVSGGTLNLKSTGYAGKAINIDGALTISGGTITANATGSSSDTYGSAKGIKSEGAMTISGGTIIATSSSHEGIESKSTLTITDGYVYSNASDDAINASSHLTISGGYVMAYSTGNDGIDANGNLYIKGGNVLAISASSPEVALDANTEGGYQLYITGGNVVAIGGLEQGASVSGTAYQASSYSQGTTYGLYNGSTLAFAYTIPSGSSSNRAPGGGTTPGGGGTTPGGGGSSSSGMGTPMVVYTTGSTAVKSGVTGSGTNFWNGYGYTSCSGGSSVSLSTYSSGSGGGGGWGW